MSRDLRRKTLDALRELNEKQNAELAHPETVTRIAQYELAYRMQTAVPGVMDITKEPQHVLDDYGAKPGEASFANNCLLARRLVEQGVRFVQLFDWGWDFHGTGPNEDIRDGLTNKMARTDKPVAALIRDLKQRGMLEDTLVVWGGEFGRTPMSEKGDGRDHNPTGFTMWMAGGGVRGGQCIGSTDELGLRAVDTPLHVHDLHATILWLLGLGNMDLVYKHKGRPERPTLNEGEPFKPIAS
jgi:hypothetical protein